MAKSTYRVIVLGAGASSSYNESPTGQKPPLAKEIIPTFHKLDISANRLVLVGHIINYVRDTRGIDPLDFEFWDEDIEFFLTTLDEEIHSLIEKLPFNKEDVSRQYQLTLATCAYKELIFLFSSIFNEIQNGPVSIPYALLANELTANDTIITFNWDTLMDRALMSTNKWFPNNGYYIQPDNIFDDGWKAPDSYEQITETVEYLKLHGSTNWLMPYHGVNLTTGEQYTLNGYAMDKLFLYWRATQPYETYQDRFWGPYEPFSYCYYPPNLPLNREDDIEGYSRISILSAIDLPSHGETKINDDKVYSMPLIVPPLRNKQYSKYGKIFSQLWARAKEAISGCNELHIIGYSFPDTDFASRELFVTALRQNKALQRLVIINPSPDKIKKLCIEEFGVDSSKVITRSEKFGASMLSTKSIL